MGKFKFHQIKILFPIIIVLITSFSGFGNKKSPPSPPPPPLNDDCSGAISITPTTTGVYSTYDNFNSTPSIGVPAPGCASYMGGDVWFSVMVPLSGHLIFDSKAGTMTNGGMAIYSGGCMGLTLLACNDNKGPAALYTGDLDYFMPQIDRIGLPVYMTIYIRFWGSGSNNFGSFQLSVIYSPPQPPCTNLGFENNYDGWFTTLGQQYDGATTAGTPTYVPISFNNTSDPNFTIETTGTDMYGGFPKVYSGTKSLRIGETATYQNYDGASVEQSFIVGTNTNFIYHYAVVLQTGGHPFYQQPFFQIDLFDQNGSPISCGIYSVALPSSVFIQSTVLSSAYYKPWTTISVNLSAYVGQSVTIRFTASDCSPGGHWGYAYLDCSCQPFDITSATDTICAGFNDTLYAPPGANSYSWTGAGIIGSTSSQILVVSPTTTTTYNCNVTTQGNTLCSSNITKKIIVDPGFVASASNNSPICPGDTLFLNSTSPAGMISYHWTGPNGFTANTANAFIPNATPAMSGTYTVTVKNARGCSSSPTTAVTLHPLPTIVTTDGTACIGDTATLSASGGVSYVWSSGANTATTGVAPLLTTTYRVKVTNQFGCVDSSTAVAHINPLPTIQLTGGTSICMGDNTTLTASGGVSYLWDNTATTAAITVSPTSLKNYKVVVTDGNGCSDSSSIAVDVFPLPIPVITQEMDTICKGAYVSITATGGTIYQWSSGESTNSIYVKPIVKTIYTVTVSNTYNNIICSETASTEMNVRNCNVIYIPNSFSPSGYNTIFKPIGEIVISKTYQFAIYNRWGQLIFETTDIHQGWDGRYKGEYVPAGAYIYYLHIDNGYEDPYEKIGTVTVIE
ncbi:MAG: gliding motility-associated C-terminal domain-containing protein [Bacteroidota bacterium]